MRQLGIKSYVGFGSCLEFGSLTGEVNEEEKGKDVGNFGSTKLELLDRVRSSFEHHIWFRPFYLVGSRQHENSLLNSAILKLSSGEQFLPRNPNSTFDFIAIEDAIEAFSSAILFERAYGAYNFGSGKLNSVNFLLNIMREKFRIPILDECPEEGMWANTEKLRIATSWTSRTSINETIQRFIEESTSVKK
jgi:nucleoside-diphosphate-sugar epimerase